MLIFNYVCCMLSFDPFFRDIGNLFTGKNWTNRKRKKTSTFLYYADLQKATVIILVKTFSQSHCHFRLQNNMLYCTKLKKVRKTLKKLMLMKGKKKLMILNSQETHSADSKFVFYIWNGSERLF